MKWKKLEQIFEFPKTSFADTFLSHAQSPQAVVFDDFIRIYFSTRKSTSDGQFLSYVQYVDYDKTFSKIVGQSNGEVISLGSLGCYDEHGIFPVNPVRVDNKIYAYLSGWTRRVSVAVDSGIGLAVSEDGGETFQRVGAGPVLTSSVHEPFLVIDGFVRIFSGKFHMWYIYGTAWKVFAGGGKPERIYVIGHATSSDGINWQKSGRQIIESKFDVECQALPTVIKIESRYHMYFCCRNAFDFRKNSKNGYRLAHAYSDDLINWTRDYEHVGIALSNSGWDSEMMCYPHLLEVDEQVYMLYNGNEFGKHGFGLAVLEEV